MARDKRKYYYPQPGIPRTQVLERLRAEAKARGVPFATHITDLLTDRDGVLYGTSESQGIWFPRGMPAPARPLGQEPISRGPDIQGNLDAFSQFLDNDEDDMPTVPRMPAVEVPR